MAPLRRTLLVGWCCGVGLWPGATGLWWLWDITVGSVLYAPSLAFSLRVVLRTHVVSDGPDVADRMA